MNFKRYYRSMVSYEGPLGFGWDHAYNQRINKIKGKLIYNQGNRIVEFRKSNNRYKPEPGAYFDLSFNENEIVIKIKNHRCLIFEKAIQDDCFRIKVIRDTGHQKDGIFLNEIKFEYYKGTDFLDTVIDAEGNKLKIEYFTKEKAGLIKSIRFKQVEYSFQYELRENHWVLVSVGLPSTFYNISSKFNHSDERLYKRYSYEKYAVNEPVLTKIYDPDDLLICLNTYETSDYNPQYRSVLRQENGTKFIPENGEYYKIISKYNGKCISLHEENDEDDRPLTLTDYNENPSQIWQFNKIDNYYSIQSKLNKKCVDLKGWNKNNGVVIQQWLMGKDPGNNQQWYFKSNSNGTYGIYSRHSGKLFEVDDDRILQTDDADKEETQWYIVKYTQRWIFDSRVKHGKDHLVVAAVIPPGHEKIDENSGYRYLFKIDNNIRQKVPTEIFKPGLEYPIRYFYNTSEEVVEINYSDGSYEKFLYDEKNKMNSLKGNLLEKKSGNDGKLEVDQDYKKISKQYEYEPHSGLLLKEKVMEDQNTVFVKNYTRDQLTGDLVKTSYGNEESFIKNFLYNEYGQVLSESDPDGYTKIFEYYDRGGKIKKILFSNPGKNNGNILRLKHNEYNEEFRYDSLGFLNEHTVGTKKTIYVNNILGLPLIVIGPEQIPTFFSYNGSGQKTNEIQPIGYKNAFAFYKFFKTLETERNTDQKAEGLLKDDFYSFGDRIFEDTAKSLMDNGLIKVSSFEYSAEGRMIMKSMNDFANANFSKRIHYFYGHDGRLLKKILPSGLTVRSIKKGNSELIAKTILTTTTEISDLVRLSQFEYDNIGKLIKEFNAGVKYEYMYDGFGRIARTETEDKYVVEQRISALGNVTEAKYSQKNSEKLLHQEFKWYNLAGMITKHTKTVDDGISVSENYKYDTGGRLTEVNHERQGATTKIYYDFSGREIARLNSENKGSINVYKNDELIAKVMILDPEKKIFQPEIYRYNDAGLLVEKMNWKNDLSPDSLEKSLFTYDTGGRLIMEIHNNKITEYEYDIFSRMIKKREYDKNSGSSMTGKIYKYGYDENDQILETQLNVHNLRFSDAVYMGEDTKKWNYYYDKFGRLIEEKDPNGLNKGYEYSDESRIKCIKLKNSNKTKWKVLEIGYDKLKRAVSISQDNEKIQEIKYDMFDNVIKAIQYYSNPEELSDELPEKILTSRNYNGLNQITSETTSLLFRNEPKPQKNNERTIKYLYDYKNGIIRKKIPLAGDKFWQEEVRHFDVSGNLTDIISQSFSVSYEYLGNLVKRKNYSDPSKPIKQKLSADYTYDANNRLQSLRIKDKNKNHLNLDYDYTGNSFLVKENSIDLEWSNDGRINSLKRIKFYKYDTFSRLIFSNYQDILPGDLEYENELKSAFENFNNSHNIAVLGNYFDYDESDNLVASANETSSLSKPLSVLYQEEDKVQKVRISKTGNPIHDKSALFYINALNGLSDRLEKITNYRNELQNIDYDDLGRVKTFIDEDKSTWKYEYNDLNQLIKASSKVKAQINVYYRYDVWGRRILKIIERNGIQKVMSLYDHDKVIIDFEYSENVNWRPLAQYLWGAGEHEILLANLPDKKIRENDENFTNYWMFQDAGGNVMLSAYIKNEKQNFNIVDLQDYMNFGDNNNKVRIEEVKSNLVDDPNYDDPQAQQYKNILDPNPKKSWKLLPDENGQIDIILDKEVSLLEMKLFASRFWKKFEVYLIPSEYLESHTLENSECVDVTNKDIKKYKLPDVEGKRDEELPNDWISINCERNKTKIIVLTSSERKRIEMEYINLQIPRTEIHDFGFAGARFDSETGLYYHESRYRLPVMQGRFLSPDPLAFLIEGNHYAYANNNPVSMYDPDGRILNLSAAAIGAAVGFAAGAAIYGYQVFRKKREFNYRDFFVYSGTGAAAGALAGLTAGVSLSVTAKLGVAAKTASAIAGASAGAVGGGINSGVITGYDSYQKTQNWNQSLKAGVKAAGIGALVGAVGGTVGGAVMGNAGANLEGFVKTGISAGASGGALSGGISGYRNTGNLKGVLMGSLKGATIGAAAGAAAGVLAYGAANLFADHLDGLNRLNDYPDKLPRPEGLLVRTARHPVNYDNLPAQLGFDRHHITPISLGGANTISNIQYINSSLHGSIPHPPPSTYNDPYGTIYLF